MKSTKRFVGIIVLVASMVPGVAAAQDRFIDNRDGTITDEQTGLMWEKKVMDDGLPNYGNPHDSDNRYTWSCFNQLEMGELLCQPDAASSRACFAGAEGSPAGCVECPDKTQCIQQSGIQGFAITAWEWLNSLNEGTGFAGHSDWRNPRSRSSRHLRMRAERALPLTSPSTGNRADAAPIHPIPPAAAPAR